MVVHLQGNGRGLNNQGANPDGPPPGTMATGPVDANEQPVEKEELTFHQMKILKKMVLSWVFSMISEVKTYLHNTPEKCSNMDHVTLSGTITCKGDECDVPFVLRITPSFQPTEEDGPLSENLKMEEGGTITANMTRGGGDLQYQGTKIEWSYRTRTTFGCR